jgi:hypothetical protein
MIRRTTRNRGDVEGSFSGAAPLKRHRPRGVETVAGAKTFKRAHGFVRGLSGLGDYQEIAD